MRVRSFLVLVAAVAAMAGAVASAGAQTPFRPVAVVNDSAITGFDLAQREQILRLLGFPADDQEALRSAALEQLVQDRLKLQAARQMGIEITPELVQAGIEDLARRAGTEPDALRGLMSAQGISGQAIEDMATAEMAWLQVIRARFGDRIRPDEAEIDAELALVGDGTATEYRILEIGLPIETSERSEAETRALAEDLAARLQAGGDFAAAVARYSRAPSAERGGEVGWISTERMPPQLGAMLAGMEVGEVSQPLPVSGGISILKLLDKRSTDRPVQPDTATREAIRERMMNERGARLADGLLQEMRRDALIEVR